MQDPCLCSASYLGTFPRSNVPADITSQNPSPSTWDSQYLKAAWASSTCATNQYFKQHAITFDITLCGTWAGAAYRAREYCLYMSIGMVALRLTRKFSRRRTWRILCESCDEGVEFRYCPMARELGHRLPIMWRPLVVVDTHGTRLRFFWHDIQLDTHPLHPHL